MKLLASSLFLIGPFLFTALSFAQSVNIGVNLSANIPFSFTVERTLLPPGHYTVRSLGAADGKTLLIQSSDHRWIKSVRTHGVYSSAGPDLCKLRFLAYGDKHFLWEVWMPGQQAGNQLSKTAAAIELESEAHRPKAVEVVADRQ
jgi:hypothetical protein